MRERWIDETRGYALLLVVLGHMGISYFGQYFTSCHLPIFYFLSGYLFSAHDSFPVFVKKKAKRLLVPYLTFGVILLISSVIRSGGEGISELLTKFVLQKRMYTIWFLTSLFFVNLAFYGITKINKGKLWSIITIAILMYVAGVTYYKLGGAPLFWNIDTVLITMIWFSLGYVLKQTGFMSRFSSETKNLNKMRIFLVAVLSGLIYISLVFVNWELCHEKFDIAMCSTGIPPLTLFASFAGIILFISISLLIKIGLINYLGKNTMVYFALHQSLMLPIIAWIYATLGLFTQETMISDLIRLIVSLVLIFVCLYPIDRLLNSKKLKFLLGK